MNQLSAFAFRLEVDQTHPRHVARVEPRFYEDTNWDEWMQSPVKPVCTKPYLLEKDLNGIDKKVDAGYMEQKKMAGE